MRVAYLDYLKIFACFSVILLHVSAGFWVKGGLDFDWFLVTIVRCSTVMGVPLFFMISGALYLSKPIGSILDFYKKVCASYILPLFAALIVYKIHMLIHVPGEPIFSGLLYDIRMTAGYHLWYMWAFFGLLLITPILRLIASNKNACGLFCGLSLFFIFLQNVGTGFPIDNQLFMYPAGYFMAGHYIHNYYNNKFSKKHLFVCVVASIFGVVLYTYLMSIEVSKPVEKGLGGDYILVAIASVACFALFKGTFRQSAFDVKFISSSTFFIYLYHVLIMSYLPLFFDSSSFILSITLEVPVIFTLGLALRKFGRMIPFIKVIIP